MAPKDNFFDLQEGYLHAWFKQGTTDKVILFCHGNAGNLTHRQDKLIELSKSGHSVLIFDYSGFGHSRGVPNEEMCYANADTFVGFLLRKGYKKENIIPYGESLGGAVASYVARKYNLPKVVLESSVPGIRELINVRFPRIKFLGVFFDEFNTTKYIDGYRGKTLVLHCVNDEVVPHESVQKLLNMATESVDMDGSHNSPTIPWEKVLAFIA